MGVITTYRPAALFFLTVFGLLLTPLYSTLAATDSQVVEISISTNRGANHGAQAVPFKRAGTTVGVRFFRIDPASIFAEAGLANNDILKQIDGAPISDPVEALMLFEAKTAGIKKSILIERQHKDLQITIKFVE